MSDLCSEAGIKLEENSELSTRVCQTGFQKTYLLCTLTRFVASELNEPRKEKETINIEVSIRIVASFPGRSPARKLSRWDENPSPKQELQKHACVF